MIHWIQHTQGYLGLALTNCFDMRLLCCWFLSQQCTPARENNLEQAPLWRWLSFVSAGDDFNSSNLINMAAVLFMWVTMPAFGAAAYVPSITLGERHV